MLPRLVVVQGVNNCGKTTTIRKAYNVMRVRANTRLAAINRGEVRGVILEFERVRVGWFSVGDVEWILRPGVSDLIKLDCDVIVCACRSRGGTFDYLEGLRREGHAVRWVEKRRANWEDQQEEENQAKAEELVKAIERTIEEVKEARRAACRERASA